MAVKVPEFRAMARVHQVIMERGAAAMKGRGRNTAAAGMSRRKALTLGGFTIAAVMLTPFEALARGLTVEGVSAAYAADVRRAIELMRNLTAVRVELLACQERLKALNPYSKEGRSAELVQDHWLWEQRQMMWGAAGIVSGVAWRRPRNETEAAVQQMARTLWHDLYGKEVRRWKPDYAVWAEKNARAWERRQAARRARQVVT
jgi:hypothetical protein